MAAELEQENMTPVSCRCCDQVVASIAALALELVARHREVRHCPPPSSSFS